MIVSIKVEYKLFFINFENVASLLFIPVGWLDGLLVGFFMAYQPLSVI